MKYLIQAVLWVVCVIGITSCTYRQPGIEEQDSATIKGYFLKYQANYIFPFFWPEGVQIIAGNSETRLRENIRDHIGNRAETALVAPGYQCIVVEVDPVFGSILSCPFCFDVRESGTYLVRTHWEYRWPELYWIEYVDILEEDSGLVVAEQRAFCKGWECNECPTWESTKSE